MTKGPKADGRAKDCIRVLCVDDHRIVRDGLAALISRQPGMEVVASAATGHEAVALFKQHLPDITLMDLQLGPMNGVEAIAAIRRHSPDARVIVLTMAQGDEDIHRALEAGASTYLLKDTAFEDLVSVVRDVHAGKPPAFSDSVKTLLATRASRPTLTAREVQLLDLIRKGMRNWEIGTALGISEETVQTHVRNILAKLEAQDRTAAVDIALRRGILHVS
jgi:two-component system NarL family response regulator